MKPQTKLIHIETPGNPTNVVSDISAISEIAHENGARVSVDNTFLSPVLQKPLDLGADIVMHSMTKFLNGHADVVAGIVVLKDEEDYNRYRKTMNLIGGVIDPFNAFLVARGIKTLAIRMERHCENAEKIAEYLDNHTKVDEVHFPWLPSHPQHEVAKRQMMGAGGIISFELKGGLEAGKKLMNSVKVHTLAVSLGGVESLIQHPASMTHAGMDPAERKKAGITDGLVRISVGIENVDELIEDLDQGLSGV
jgi:methionine-gamma-lyase